MNEPETSSDTAVKPKAEDLAEEILGLNWRGVRTVWATFVRPRAVFKAFAERDRVPYTPPLRIWLTLMSLQILVSVLWGGLDAQLYDDQMPADPPMIAFDAAADPASGELPGCASIAGAPTEFPALVQRSTGACFAEFTELYGQIGALVQPPLFGLFSLLHIFVLGWFNKSLSWQARFNMTFLFQVVASLLGLVVAPFVLGGGQSPLILLAIMPAILIATFVRTGRGVLASSLPGLWIKAVVFSIASTATMLLAGIAMGVVAISFTMWQLMP